MERNRRIKDTFGLQNQQASVTEQMGVVRERDVIDGFHVRIIRNLVER